MDNLKLFVVEFINQIWNKRNFDVLGDFLHPDFKDHSLPPILSPDAEGMKKWILGTSMSFEHQTIIEDQVTEGDKSILKISMQLMHIGTWRGIEPTGKQLKIDGYRFYKLKDSKIVEHWALIDGQAIESQLRSGLHGCKIPG